MRQNHVLAPMNPNLQLLQITLQALSAFAIAGGLLYTAFQFREARKAQSVGNFAKLVELQLQLRRMRVEHPELAAAHKADVEHLHSPAEVQAYFLSLMQLSLFEIAWYAHEQKTASRGLLQIVGAPHVAAGRRGELQEDARQSRHEDHARRLRHVRPRASHSRDAPLVRDGAHKGCEGELSGGMGGCAVESLKTLKQVGAALLTGESDRNRRNTACPTSFVAPSSSPHCCRWRRAHQPRAPCR